MTTSNFPTRTAVSEAEDGKSWIRSPPTFSCQLFRTTEDIF